MSDPKKPTKETAEARGRKRRQPGRDAQPSERDAPPSEDELSTDDLVGESEHSVRVSGGGGRRPEPEGGPPRQKTLSAKPEDLGRRILEDLTEAPGSDDEDDEDYQAERG
jgi:hypothetical protein